MQTVNIAELKNRLSHYLRQVRAGEEILVRDRARPVVKIVPLSATNDFSAEELELVADGIISLPAEELDIEAFLALPRAAVPVEAAAQAVVDDREESETRILGQ